MHLSCYRDSLTSESGRDAVEKRFYDQFNRTTMFGIVSVSVCLTDAKRSRVIMT